VFHVPTFAYVRDLAALRHCASLPRSVVEHLSAHVCCPKLSARVGAPKSEQKRKNWKFGSYPLAADDARGAAGYSRLRTEHRSSNTHRSQCTRRRTESQASSFEYQAATRGEGARLQALPRCDDLLIPWGY
jgi:hypothetical protein